MRAVGCLLVLVGCGPTYLDAAGLAPTTLGDGLVAHWAFDDTAGTIASDDSGNRRDGAVSGATFTSDGHFGGALRFLPGDSVTVANFPYAPSSWTFSGWLRIDEEDIANDDFGTVISTEHATQESGWQWQTRSRSEGIYWTFAYWIGPGLNYAHYECECFELGRWSHAAVVVDGKSNVLSFYVDGALAQSSPLASPILPGHSDLLMGKWAGEGRLFSGSIDDVAIYDRALLSAEIGELHERPPPRPR